VWKAEEIVMQEKDGRGRCLGHNFSRGYPDKLTHGWDWLWLAILVSALTACRKTEGPGQALSGSTGPVSVVREGVSGRTDSQQEARQTQGTLDEKTLEAVRQFNRGTALLEQYRYSEAAEVLRKVVEEHPDWLAAKFNLGLAYLNMQEAKGAEDYLVEAKRLFEEILATQPDHLHARFCLGLLLEHIGENEKALDCFQRVYEADPEEPTVAYKLAEMLLAVGKEQEGTALLEKLVEAEPGFVSGIYRLAVQYQRLRQPEKAKPLFARFKALNAQELAGGTFTVRKVYGSAGKYYLALGADNLPIIRQISPGEFLPQFSPEVTRLGEALSPWKAGNVDVGLPPVVVADWNKDNLLDLCVATPTGEIWLYENRGQRQFSRKEVAKKSATQLAVGDLDNDGNLDLWIAGENLGEILYGDGQGNFRSVSLPELAEKRAVLLARPLDWDADGDLDLLAVLGREGSIPVKSADIPTEIVVLVNRLNGSFEVQENPLSLANQSAPVSAVMVEDFDGDRDLDLAVFSLGAPGAEFFENHRVGIFGHRAGQDCKTAVTQVIAATCADVNKDNMVDLLLFTVEGVQLFLNRGTWQFEKADTGSYPFQSFQATSGCFTDLDNDGDLDLLLADVPGGDKRGPRAFVNSWPGSGFWDLEKLSPGNIFAAVEWEGAAGLIPADLDNDGALDLVFAPQQGQVLLVWGLGSGGNWLQVNLIGTQGQDQKTRSNAAALGARLEIKASAVSQLYLVGQPTGPTTVAPLRIHAGLGKNDRVDWLRVIWPDGVLQAELEVAARQIYTLTELQRKISSCPHLFAWTGNHFQFVSDFGGKGGLGYWVGPGRYAKPQPLELVPLPVLSSREGRYVLQIVEPLEEVVYLDEVKLWVVDHPEGTVVRPREIMAVGIQPPAPEVLCFEKELIPLRAIDHRGVDVTAQLAEVDRRCAGATQPDPRFAGYAAEHFVELEFDLSELAWGEGERIFLVADGWVNYAYSSTNFAAYQAGLRLQAPTLSVYREGHWVPLLEQVGYPAGINHVMVVELSGLVAREDRRFRIVTNMDLYWDRIALGVVSPRATKRLIVRELGPVEAVLDFYGFPREYSPDGRRPNLYDYHNVDRSYTWKRPCGQYSQFGRVTPLVEDQDDGFVIMGPGEQLTVEFEADLPEPPQGYRRSFVLKTFSYCKDMDWHTAFGQTVEPLPFSGMSDYPYAAGEESRANLRGRTLNEKLNQRTVSGR
jgi:tetratricopeptide (TPR) repeat protein